MAYRRRYRRPVRRKNPPRNSDVMTVSGRTSSRDGVAPKYAERILEGLKESSKTLKSISHYEIVEQLGEGGMGTVFLGHHVSEGGIRKEVAIKVLKDTTDEQAIHSFVEEAQLLAQLTQGTVVELLALESMNVNLGAQRNPRSGRIAPPSKRKLYFMVQEYINGPGLEDVLQDLHENVLLMTPAMVGFILNKSVLALAEAHFLTDENDRPVNLIHRDISPSNILFNAKAGITKLADFGVAKAFSGGSADENEPTIVGKPRYMAPEQLDGNAITASDIWALGVIGYECLTGFSPYRVFGKTLNEKIRNLKTQFRFPLRAPKEMLHYPEGGRFDVAKLSDIIMQCLSQNPGQRPNALELNAMLEGGFLYNKGLGPTNKTLAAYLRLLECAIGDGEVIPPPGFSDSDDAKVLCATLWVDDPVAIFQKRTSRIYDADFVNAVKGKAANPCLGPLDGKAFSPDVSL